MVTNWQKVECQKFIFWISLVVFNLMLFIIFVHSKHSGFIVKVWQLTWRESIKNLDVQSFMKNGCVHCTSKSSQTKKRQQSNSDLRSPFRDNKSLKKFIEKEIFLLSCRVLTPNYFSNLHYNLMGISSRNKLKKH